MNYKMAITSLRGILLLSMLAACGQTTGCSGCDQGPGNFPAKDRIYNAAQLRVTQSGLVFLEDNLEPVLAELLPEDGLNICLPGEEGETIGIEYGFCNSEMCPEEGLGCNLNIAIRRVDLGAQEPNILTATIEFDQLSTRIPIQADPIAACEIAIDGAGFEVGLPLSLFTPEPERFLSFSLTDQVQYELRDIDVRLEGTGGILGWVCDGLSFVINFPFIRDFIFDSIQGFIDGLLSDQLRGFVENFTCRSCVDDLGCPTNQGASCVEDQCRLPDGACVATKLGLDGELDVGALTQQVTPGLSALVEYLAVIGSYATVEENGISIGMVGGARSVRNRCVPQTSQPDIIQPERSDLLSGNLDILERDYHLGIGLTQAFAEHFSWAFFNSGALCLQVTNATVEQLNAGILSIVLPNLADLAGNPNAPIAITMAPQQVPQAIFGENRFEIDDDGNRQLIDPAIRIVIPELWIDFHVFMDDRWVRIFSLHTNVDLPLGLDFTPDNEIIPILGDIASGLTDLRTTNGGIMQDDPELLASLLPTILNLFVGDLATGLLTPIALPDLLGFSLDLQDRAITSIDEGSILAIFARLRSAAEQQANLSSVETEIQHVEFRDLETSQFRAAGLDTFKQIELLVEVEAIDSRVDDSIHEYSWRIDEGTWSAFQTGSVFSVRHPSLLLQGAHSLEVRARRADDYRTLDPTPSIYDFVIDTVPPTLSAQRADDEVIIHVSDLISERANIQVEYALAPDLWVRINDSVLSIDDSEIVTIRATDEAGLTTTLVVEARRDGLIGRPAPGDRNPTGGCECDQSGGEKHAFWMSLILLGLCKPRRRLNRRRMMVWLAIGAAFMVGCDDSSGASRDQDQDVGMVDELCTESEACENQNQFCQSGICQPVGCSDDADCSTLSCGDAANAVCHERGLCRCQPFCADGCTTDQYCCISDNRCRDLPDECAQLDCPLGDIARVEFVSEGDPLACDDETWNCYCEPTPAVPLGVIGRYSSITTVGDKIWVSAYADTYGDLVVGQYRPNGTIKWHWVDGLPSDVEPQLNPSGPRGGVVENGPDVGLYTALVAGPGGALHVVYYDAENQALKYALGVPDEDTFEWTVSTLDSLGNAGLWPSISVDDDGKPGVAYRVSNLDGVSQVRFVQATSPRPMQSADWGEPYVLHDRPLDPNQLDLGTYPEGTGLFTTQARMPNGGVMVAWYDRSVGQLYMTVQNEDGFSNPGVLAGWESGSDVLRGDMGANVDLTIDEDGQTYLCFQDGQTDSLRFLSPELNLSEWVDDGVWLDVGGRGHSVHVVGEDCNIELDGDGQPLIVYQDSTMQALLMRRRTRVSPDGDRLGWGGRQSLRGDSDRFTGSHGFYVSTARLGSRLYISHFVYRNHVEPARSGLEVFSVEL
ncbi:MAG: hypothetical protein VYA30_10275 [Myxococcota bacterium]|nr:hypothetical protein [Myxococcota bacterium]